MVSTDWMSGDFGDSPGPTTYWIDAVVALPEETYGELRGAFVLTSDSRLPSDFSPELSAGLQSHSLYSSEDLNAEFSSDRIQSKVFLDDATFSVMISSVLE